jgi:hypothetical protein
MNDLRALVNRKPVKGLNAGRAVVRIWIGVRLGVTP